MIIFNLGLFFFCYIFLMFRIKFKMLLSFYDVKKKENLLMFEYFLVLIFFVMV